MILVRGVCGFIELHITAQSGPVILVIICHSCVCVCVCDSLPIALVLPRGYH